MYKFCYFRPYHLDVQYLNIYKFVDVVTKIIRVCEINIADNLKCKRDGGTT